MGSDVTPITPVKRVRDCEVGAQEPKLGRCPRGKGICLPRPRLAAGGAAVLWDVSSQRKPYRRREQKPPPDQMSPLLCPVREPPIERRAMVTGRADQLDLLLDPLTDPPPTGRAKVTTAER